MHDTLRASSPRPPASSAAILLFLLACGSAGAGPQTPGEIPTRDAPVVTRSEASEGDRTGTGVELVCEVFCSETELRTAIARLRWKLVPGPALDTGEAARLSSTGQQLQTTVFHRGFEKDLYVTLPLSREGQAAEAAPATARQGKGTMRAYQLRLREVRLPDSAERFAAGEQEAVAEVENLEPGMRYTWRLVPEGADERSASPTVSCLAPVCPADMVQEGPQ